MTAGNPPSARILQCPPGIAVHLPDGTAGRVARPFDGQPPDTPVSGAVRWYALRTAPCRGFRVREALRREGIPEFLPVTAETVRWTDRSKIIQRPLFAGYIFAQFDRSADAARVLAISGVLQILGDPAHPEFSEVPASELHGLRLLFASPGPVERVPYVAGSAVRIVSGPFAGVTGTVTQTRSGSAFLTVAVPLLNGAARVRIDAADCASAKEK